MIKVLHVLNDRTAIDVLLLAFCLLHCSFICLTIATSAEGHTNERHMYFVYDRIKERPHRQTGHTKKRNSCFAEPVGVSLFLFRLLRLSLSLSYLYQLLYKAKGHTHERNMCLKSMNTLFIDERKKEKPHRQGKRRKKPTFSERQHGSGCVNLLVSASLLR